MSDSSKYLVFEQQQFVGRKTPVITVRSKSSGSVLGMIMWWGRWRQFCFFPSPNTVFNIKCMDDITDVIGKLHEERRQSKA